RRARSTLDSLPSTPPRPRTPPSFEPPSRERTEMSRPEATEIRINRQGDEVHESWLLIRATKGRYGATGTRLFGSDINHLETVTIHVFRCSRKRELNRDWKHQTQTLMEFEMSLAQWAAFISSFGDGSGVPATLRFLGFEEGTPRG